MMEHWPAIASQNGAVPTEGHAASPVGAEQVSTEVWTKVYPLLHANVAMEPSALPSVKMTCPFAGAVGMLLTQEPGAVQTGT